MKTSSKVPAFTILEVTISMVLAAICIAVAYSSYTLISRAYKEFDSKNQKLSSHILLNRLLNEDIRNSDRMFRIPEGVLMKNKNGEIIYTVSADFIIRDQYQLSIDTLIVKNRGFHTFFENEETQPGDLCDKAEIETLVENDWIPLVFTKHYSSSELIEGRLKGVALKE